MTHHDHEHHHCLKPVSWTAVFAGAFVAIGLSFLLNLFSVAIGASVFSVTNGTPGLAIGGLIALAIGTIISMFIAGYVAGFLGRPYCPMRNLGMLYGFVTWALALIITVIMATYVAQYIAAYSNFIANPATIIVASTPAATGAPTMENAPNIVGMVAFLMFVLFFIGAVSCCAGAHYGMVSKYRELP